MGSDKEILSAVRSVELEVGRVMRRQSGIMDMLRDVRGVLHDIETVLKRIEKGEKAIKTTIAEHDKWERETKE